MIVGSAFVDIIAKNGKDAGEKLETLARELKEGIRSVKG